MWLGVCRFRGLRFAPGALGLRVQDVGLIIPLK